MPLACHFSQKNASGTSRRRGLRRTKRLPKRKDQKPIRKNPDPWDRKMDRLRHHMTGTCYLQKDQKVKQRIKKTWYRWYRCPTANSESTKCTNIGRVHHAQPSSELTTVVRSCSSLMFDLGHLHGGNSQFFKTRVRYFFSLDFTLMNPNYAMIARTISMCHDYCQLLVRIWG